MQTHKNLAIFQADKYYETNEQRQEDSLTMSNPGYLDTNLQCVTENKLVSTKCKSKATALALRYGREGAILQSSYSEKAQRSQQTMLWPQKHQLEI